MPSKRLRFDVADESQPAWPAIPQPIDDGHCELCREPCDHLLRMEAPTALVCCACARLTLTQVVSRMLDRGIVPQSRMVQLPEAE